MSDPGFLGLVREHIRSVWSLELLLLMRRTPTRAWTVDELVRELRASTVLVTDNLTHFERVGLIVPEEQGRYRFAPAGPLLAEFCDNLAEAYQTKPVALINIIASKGALQTLADAFKFKGEDR